MGGPEGLSSPATRDLLGLWRYPRSPLLSAVWRKEVLILERHTCPKRNTFTVRPHAQANSMKRHLKQLAAAVAP